MLETRAFEGVPGTPLVKTKGPEAALAPHAFTAVMVTVYLPAAKEAKS